MVTGKWKGSDGAYIMAPITGILAKSVGPSCCTNRPHFGWTLSERSSQIHLLHGIPWPESWIYAFSQSFITEVQERNQKFCLGHSLEIDFTAPLHFISEKMTQYWECDDGPKESHQQLWGDPIKNGNLRFPVLFDGLKVYSYPKYFPIHITDDLADLNWSYMVSGDLGRRNRWFASSLTAFGGDINMNKWTFDPRHLPVTMFYTTPLAAVTHFLDIASLWWCSWCQSCPQVEYCRSARSKCIFPRICILYVSNNNFSGSGTHSVPLQHL
jgi:hypothetical protein